MFGESEPIDSETAFEWMAMTAEEILGQPSLVPAQHRRGSERKGAESGGRGRAAKLTDPALRAEYSQGPNAGPSALNLLRERANLRAVQEIEPSQQAQRQRDSPLIQSSSTGLAPGQSTSRGPSPGVSSSQTARKATQQRELAYKVDTSPDAKVTQKGDSTQTRPVSHETIPVQSTEGQL